MCRSLLKENQELVVVRYFTTRVSGDPDAERRQAIFIDALESRGGIEIDYGHFLSKKVTCSSCKNVRQKNEEKKTDVNIAVRLMDDAFDDSFDLAMVISGDSDLVPAIESVRRRHPAKFVLVAFPPKRTSTELKKAANASLNIGRQKIRSNRLPSMVETPGGHILRAPKGWLPGRPQH